MLKARDKIEPDLQWIVIAFDEVRASSGLYERISRIAANPDENSQFDRGLSEEVAPPPLRRAGRYRVRRWLPVLAPLAVAIGVLAIFVLSSLNRSTGTQTAPVIAVPDNPELVCDTPTGEFARFWLSATGGDHSAWYEGVVSVNGAPIPALSIYSSAGQAGHGVMCVSNTRALAGPPVRSVATGTDNPLAYLALDYTGVLWGATRPDVTRVTVSVSGAHEDVYSSDDAPGPSQLQAIGSGWHAFSSAVGLESYPLSTIITAKCFDASGDLIGVRTESIANLVPQGKNGTAPWVTSSR